VENEPKQIKPFIVPKPHDYVILVYFGLSVQRDVLCVKDRTIAGFDAFVNALYAIKGLNEQRVSRLSAQAVFAWCGELDEHPELPTTQGVGDVTFSYCPTYRYAGLVPDAVTPPPSLQVQF